MARSLDERNQLVKCRFCGELYSPTYKRCPFCNGDGTGRWDDLERAVQKASEYEVMGEYNAEDSMDGFGQDAGTDPLSVSASPVPKGGGKRLLNGASARAQRAPKAPRTPDEPGNPDEPAGDEGAYPYNYASEEGKNRRGFSVGRILGILLAVGLMSAAVYLVVSIVTPLITGKDANTAESQPPAISQPAEPSDFAGETFPEESGAPGGEDLPPENGESGTLSPAASEPPAQNAGAPTSFRLSNEDFTFRTAGERYHVTAAFEPAGTSAQLTWSSSDPSVASVSSDGWVTAVGRGTVTVTASAPGVGSRSCIVRCALPAAPAGQQGEDGQGGASYLRLNREDFTLGYKDEIFRMQVMGTANPVSWSSSDPQVAAIASDGTVTAVGRGKCTVTAMVDGQTLTCIVRCNF